MSKTAQITDIDLVAALVSGLAPGVAVRPHIADVPPQWLRWDGSALIDIRGLTRTWHVDPEGRPRLDRAADRQPLDCAGDAALIRDTTTGLWRVEGEPDRLAGIIARDLAAVDTTVGDLRRALQTTAPGQDEAYQAKVAELTAWDAAGRPADPDPTDYPWAAARAAMLTAAGTPTDIATVMADWQDRRAVWTQIHLASEVAREAAKHRIRAATGEAQAQAVLAALQAVCTPLTQQLAALSAAGTVPDPAAARAALAGIVWP